MNTKNLVIMALLVGVGTVLYFVIPGYGGGMKPDFMVLMMFIGILLFPTFKEMFVLSISTGVLSGLFSTFPGGFVPNIIDKLITGIVFLVVVLLLKHLVTNLIVSTLLVGLGTILSGTIFLISAILIANLPPESFAALFVTVVLVTGGLNALAFFIIYPIITNILKRSKFITAATQA
ncbi:tryptophan transporter [Ureibacillus massiliensis 4400831 = CIP 108448 = CCUG 49529]|uniref:Tryptophan transporter n=1 Tax=Ureibacillus massiliensis 4400831 = CIP 108448 = CCUG 49529 TaxID=1211035 RepID=A0A0A3J1E5_9BACL|nr:tryptophan transporter [Ureibacillus massiliensis]KGR90799.1 tryptophan transporter [Ureibacillus massiliensis 4400831 = CIP 108448 = CCUG 49529]RKJ58314.1 tryptophan transporter [Butyricicoccus sp. 1XD8-22]